jgi:hypothetical protein
MPTQTRKLKQRKITGKATSISKIYCCFLDLLQSTHPAFASGETLPFNINKVRKDGYKWAASCKSTSQLQTYLQAIATRLNDGHTTLLPELDNNLIYPCNLFIEKERIHLQSVDKQYASCLGKEINQINGQPVAEIIKSFRPIISSGTDTYFLKQVKGYMQFYSIWKSHPYCRPDSTLQLTFDDGQTIALRPMPQRQAIMSLQQVQPKKSSLTVRKQTGQPFSYRLFPEQSICYLQFNQCTDQSSLRWQYKMSGASGLSAEEFEKRVSQIPRFDRFLQAMFDTIASRNIQTLVVDVRDNGGGNSKLCDVLLSWLKPQAEIRSGSSKIRFSTLWAQQYPALATEYRQALTANGQTFTMGKMYATNQIPRLSSSETEVSVTESTASYFQKNEEASRIFHGKVFFIQNENTFSSAGMLIVDAVDNQIGTVIGTSSSYRPCDYGDLLTWQLPNTQLRGYVSHKIFLRPDASKCDEPTLKPAVYLPQTWTTLLSGEDTAWDWIVTKSPNI